MRPPRSVVVPAVAVLSAVVILGPALLPGLVQAYDLNWSPDARLTPAVWGLDTPTPRVVPSDVVVVLIGKVLTPMVAQKLVLLGALVVASLGLHRLLRTVLQREPARVAALAAVLVAQWNPFVAERLAIGQWTTLWGYALLPWAWTAALRARSGDGVLPVAAVLVAASVGGANTLLVVALAVLPVLLWRPVSGRALLVGLVTLVGGSAVWAWPALVGGSPSDSAGVGAFAARSDGPFGLLGSLVSGGGIWNASAWPAERGSWVLAGSGIVLALVGAAGVVRSRHLPWAGPLAAGAVPWLVLAVVSGWSPVRGLWEAIVAVPGGGLLRDSQKLVAPWVVLCGLGIAVLADRWARQRAPGRRALAWLVALLAVPLSLSSAVGLSGDLRAVQVPSDLRAGARVLSEAPAGTVGLLPWNQYRRYGWNDDRISLSVVPRMVDQPVLLDDSLPLRTQRVPGERADSAKVTAAIAGGASQAGALRAAGVRYLLIERGAVPSPPRVPAGAEVLFEGPHVVVAQLPGPADAPTTGEWTTSRVLGWAAWTVTCVGLSGAALVGATRRRRPRGM